MFELAENVGVCLKVLLVDFDLLAKGPSINLNRYPIVILIQQQENRKAAKRKKPLITQIKKTDKISFFSVFHRSLVNEEKGGENLAIFSMD